MISFICIDCGGGLDIEMICKGCGKVYKYEDGIYYLHKSDESWEEVNKEADGTIRCMKEDGNYKKENVKEIDLYPYKEEDKKNHKIAINRVMFDMCKEVVGKKKGSLLEIGSKNCWAVNQFLKEGFDNVVATDISDDSCTALGFGKELIEYTKNFFYRVVCDGAYLPFESNQFDVVFMCSTFHHIREKQKAMLEIYRVLKKDGVLVSMGDNPRHPERSIEDSLCPVRREREKYNIYESQPTMQEYYRFISNADFEDYYIYPFDENLLKKNWIFENSNMFMEILTRGFLMNKHKELENLFIKLDKKTKKQFTLERFTMMNYWLNIPNNTVIYARK